MNGTREKCPAIIAEICPLVAFQWNTWKDFLLLACDRPIRREATQDLGVIKFNYYFFLLNSQFFYSVVKGHLQAPAIPSFSERKNRPKGSGCSIYEAS